MPQKPDFSKEKKILSELGVELPKDRDFIEALVKLKTAFAQKALVEQFVTMLGALATVVSVVGAIGGWWYAGVAQVKHENSARDMALVNDYFKIIQTTDFCKAEPNAISYVHLAGLTLGQKDGTYETDLKCGPEAIGSSDFMFYRIMVENIRSNHFLNNCDSKYEIADGQAMPDAGVAIPRISYTCVKEDDSKILTSHLDCGLNGTGYTVYVQYQYAKGDKEQARKLQSMLKTCGYSAPGIEQVDSVPNVSQIRIYSDDDKVQAGNVADIMKKNGLVKSDLPIKVVNFSAVYKNQPAKQLEVWLALNSAPDQKFQ